MRFFYPLLSFIGCLSIACPSFSQVNLSGQINSYAAVLNLDADPCRPRLVVDQVLGFVPKTDAFLVQMQGAAISEGNNADYGRFENLNSLGLYERVRIDSIAGNELFLAAPLLQSYQTNAALQLVSLARYDNAVVTDTLRPQAWDGNKGGVLVLEVLDTLLLNAPIVASHLGFRGGVAESIAPNNCNWLIPQRAYYYGDDSWRGARKGEGVAIPSGGREAGRGPQGNAGGGGNDHNAGGGGGANQTSGGQGGENEEPSTFGCKGRFPGLGGIGVFTNENRVFMGAGGGAGHGNNGVATNGGAGGGIVILMAKQIIAPPTQYISVEGEQPPTTDGDGGGGGGAGGTVVLDVEIIRGELEIRMAGGTGGNIDNTNNRCMGPGGGGSGGVLYWNPNAVTVDGRLSIDVTAGEAGQSFQCSSSPNGARGGQDGMTKDFNGIPTSDPASILTFNDQPDDVEVCSGGSATYSIQASGGNIQYQWQVFRNNNWENLSDGATVSGSLSNSLTITNLSMTMDQWRFRCLLQIDCGGTTSQEALLSITEEAQIIQQPLLPNAVICEGDDLQIVLEARGDGLTYQWQIVENGSFVDLPESVNFQDTRRPALQLIDLPDGRYELRCQISDACGQVIFSDILQIDPEVAPTAAFFYQSTNLSVQFANNSSGGTYLWNFGDGQTSMLFDPQYTYGTAGTYAVSLLVTNDCGQDLFVDTVRLTNLLPPNAAFDLNKSQGCAPLRVQFEDQSSSTISDRLWEFEGGDPSTSTSESPLVRYDNPGVYDVRLEVSNAAGSSTIVQEGFIEVLPSPIADFAYEADGLTVRFTNLSSNTDDFVWDFGDGSPLSTERDPIHTYQQNGAYSVRLSAENSFCSSITGEVVQLFVLSQQDPLVASPLQLLPNPAGEECHLRYGSLSILRLQAYDSSGRLVWSHQPVGGWDGRIDLSHWPAGLYWLAVQTPDRLHGIKLVRQ
ncbi:MAG: PKD domain-containing protein [Bacteroidota bacterium]